MDFRPTDLGVIYMLTNPKGQRYIGQTKNLSNRMRAYQELNCKSQKILYRSLKKYGFKAHTLEILKECPIEMLDTWEYHLIDIMQSHYFTHKDKGLNMLNGPYKGGRKKKKCKHYVYARTK